MKIELINQLTPEQQVSMYNYRNQDSKISVSLLTKDEIKEKYGDVWLPKTESDLKEVYLISTQTMVPVLEEFETTINGYLSKGYKIILPDGKITNVISAQVMNYDPNKSL